MRGRRTGLGVLAACLGLLLPPARAKAAAVELVKSVTAQEERPAGRFAIAGIRFGMSPDQVRAVLAAAYPGLAVQARETVLTEAGVSSRPFTGEMRVVPGNGLVRVLFAAPTAGNGVTFVMQAVHGAAEPSKGAVDRHAALLEPQLGVRRNPPIGPKDGVTVLIWRYGATGPLPCPDGYCDLVGGGNGLDQLATLAALHDKGVRSDVWLTLGSDGGDSEHVTVVIVAAEDIDTEYRALTEARRQLTR